MKRPYLILILLLVVTNVLKAQKVQIPLSKDSVIAYEGVIKFKDTLLNKEKIYNAAKIWFSDALTNSKLTLQIYNMDSGKLIGKISTLYAKSLLAHIPDNYLEYSIDIIVKPGKYKYRIYNISLSNSPNENLSSEYLDYKNGKLKSYPLVSKKKVEKIYQSMFSKIDTDIDYLIKDLITKMSVLEKVDEF